MCADGLNHFPNHFPRGKSVRITLPAGNRFESLSPREIGSNHSPRGKPVSSARIAQFAESCPLLGRDCAKCEKTTTAATSFPLGACAGGAARRRGSRPASLASPFQPRETTSPREIDRRNRSQLSAACRSAPSQAVRRQGRGGSEDCLSERSERVPQLPRP